ncbi:MAG TPA: zf-HC2 domain-containing protein [Sphingomicrobium sp.]
MPDPIRTDAHDQVEELLPWYANGQLEPNERALVEQHLLACADCQQQLAFERRMVDEFQAFSPALATGWTRLRQRIEPREPWSDRAARAMNEFWQQLTRPPVAALAIAQFAFVVVAAGLLLSLSRPSYHALGSAPVPATANIIVMFAPDTTEAQMRGILNASGATLVGGPTEADAYLLSIPGASRSSALNKLRSERHIAMAQPIDGVAQ